MQRPAHTSAAPKVTRTTPGPSVNIKTPRDNTTANENNGYAINEAEDNQTLSYSDDDLPF